MAYTAYQAPITIKDAINNIKKRKYVLPSIQREFVWNPEQIEKLFDSLMRGYPISTFLFWKVEKKNIKDFQFYEFLKHYHQKDATHNAKADLSDDEDVIAILDGQQRLTSLYIALTGTYARKIPYYQWNNPNAFPKKSLYLNLLHSAEDIEMVYDFRFLTEAESLSPGEGYFWFKVGKVLDFKDISGVMQYLMLNGLMDTSKYSQDESNFALNTLSSLFNIIHNNGTISYYQEEDEELDKVLQIFIRINSGGTKLSYSDLLLSIATAQWQEMDAREVIHQFVDEINQFGDGFDFNKDFVLKSSLVLGDFSDIRFKVDNFKKENMLQIEQLWDSISNSLRLAIRLVAKFGFSRENLISTNAIIPIAYYLLKNDRKDNYLDSSSFKDDRRKVQEWLVRVLLKGVFGGQPDALYPVLRNIINENLGAFPLEAIIDRYKGKRKSIVFTEDDLDSLLELQYNKPRTYSALTLLYPGLNQSFRYHQDHIYPQRFFTPSKLNKEGVSDHESMQEYLNRYNKLANLQLLQAVENTEKNGKHFKEWLYEKFESEYDRQLFCQTHLIPTDVDLSFDNFVEFYEARKSIVRKQLQIALGVETKSLQIEEIEE